MDIADLVKLTSRAWSLDILALAFRGTPCRQAPLLAATGASRTALAHSLQHLIDLRLLERNPGHGHPLRPEFRLTRDGLAAAEVADRILSALPAAEPPSLLRRTWTLPVLTIVRRPMRFSMIKTELGSITDRALSLSLRQLQDRQWVERRVSNATYPPQTIYRSVNAGLKMGLAADS